MGLSVSHDAWEGSYGNFSRYREFVAKLIGHNWPDMCGTIYDDDIHYMLLHSDCDGKISLRECKKLLPRMKEIGKLIPKDEVIFSSRHKQFINGIEEAIEENSFLEFF